MFHTSAHLSDNLILRGTFLDQKTCWIHDGIDLCELEVLDHHKINE